MIDSPPEAGHLTVQLHVHLVELPAPTADERIWLIISRIASGDELKWDPKLLGLAEPPLTSGGTAVATPDGVVSLQAVSGGSQASFARDQLSIVNLIGRAVATAVAILVNEGSVVTHSGQCQQ